MIANAFGIVMASIRNRKHERAQLRENGHWQGEIKPASSFLSLATVKSSENNEFILFDATGSC